MITVEYEKFNLVCCYTPNAGDKLKRLEYRTQVYIRIRIRVWDPEFRRYVSKLKSTRPTLIAGDLNVAYTVKDIYNPFGKEKYACFTPEERSSFGRLLSDGWFDTYRYLNPNGNKFSYFSYRTNAIEDNKGWRIDYFLACEEMIARVGSSDINNVMRASDHMPIELMINV